LDAAANRRESDLLAVCLQAVGMLIKEASAICLPLVRKWLISLFLFGYDHSDDFVTGFSPFHVPRLLWNFNSDIRRKDSPLLHHSGGLSGSNGSPRGYPRVSPLK
jgi:hypothetical protein